MADNNAYFIILIKYELLESSDDDAQVKEMLHS